MSEELKHHEHDEPMPEGEEQAPPYTHTMSIVRWILLIGMSLFALTMILSYFGATPWAGSSQKAVMYHCPMHPTYVSSQPGECPICGMNLVPIDSDTTKTATTPMDKNMVMDSSAVKAKPGQYTCPMHPEVISDKPGKCPKCGMNLELVTAPSKDSMTRPMQMPDSSAMSVPGLVPVTIEPQRLQLINIRTGVVEKRSLGGGKDLVGYVTPDETRLSDVTVRISGWVQKLNVNQTGQKVDKGETLLTIYSQDLFQAEQDYLSAYTSALRQNGDTALASTRTRIIEAGRERLHLLGLEDIDISALEKAGKADAEIPLRSPLSGVVLDKAVLAGQAINSSQPLFRIADLSTVWVLADVYESDLAGIKVGQRAQMTVTAFPNEKFDGNVSFIYPTVSEQTRTMKVRLAFVNPQMRLRPGMYAQVELEGSGEPVLAVPRSAVMDDGKLAYAFVVHGGTHFEPTRITIGRSSDDWVEARTGLHEGDTVVTSANFLIDSESRLKAAISGMGGSNAGGHAGHSM